MFEHIGTAVKNTGHSIITWEWTKRLLHWLIISAGTMSECAFLIASLWMSVNASVHSLVLLVIDEPTTEHITGVATAAYVALPEMILGLAFVVTIGHLRRWLYDMSDYTAAIWTALYGLPTLVFLILSLFTLGSAVASTTFELPTQLLVIRALAGYMFAFTSLLYTQLGVPQEKDRLQNKDTELADMRAEKESTVDALQKEMQTKLQELTAMKDTELAALREKMARIEAENEEHRTLLHKAIEQNSELYSVVNQSADASLQAYPEGTIDWLNSLDKTVSVDAIAAQTGINKRRLMTAIEKKELRIRGTNKELVWTPSLRDYLIKNAPKSAHREQESGPMLRIVSG